MAYPVSAKDTSIVGEDTDCGESDLQEAVATASAGLARDLRSLGGQLASMESGHRAVLDRLQSIAGQADERARHQLSSVQQQVEGARAEILRAREDLETVFLEQVQVIQGQYESTRQQFNKTEQQLQFLEARVGAAKDKQDSVEQRLQAAERKNLEHDNWLATIPSQLGQFQRQIADAVVRIRSVEPDINAINSMLQVQAVQCENMQAQSATSRGMSANCGFGRCCDRAGACDRLHSLPASSLYYWSAMSNWADPASPAPRSTVSSVRSHWSAGSRGLLQSSKCAAGATAALPINASLYGKLNFDFVRDFAPVAGIMFGGAAAAWPLPARAQQSGKHRSSVCLGASSLIASRR